MKRWQGVLLGLVITVLCMSYAYWRAVPFIKKPSLEFRAEVPVEAKAVISKWHIENDYLSPVDFTWERYFHSLQHPYDTDWHHVTVGRTGTYEVVVQRKDTVWIFILYSNGWGFCSDNGPLL